MVVPPKVDVSLAVYTYSLYQGEIASHFGGIMYTKILAVYCGNYSGIRAKEPSGSLAVLGKIINLEPCG